MKYIILQYNEQLNNEKNVKSKITNKFKYLDNPLSKYLNLFVILDFTFLLQRVFFLNKGEALWYNIL